MREIRKRWGILSVLMLMTVLAFTGCGKKATPENLLTDMVKNSKDAKSVEANMKLAAEMGADAASMSITMDADIAATKEPEASHINATVGLKFGSTDMNTDMEMYQVKEDDEDITYTCIQDVWAKESGDKKEDVLDEGMFKDIQKAYESFELKEELVKVNDEECFELTGKIDGELLDGIIDQDMLESFSSDLNLNEDGLKDAKIPCTIDIYKDSILPARIYIDMKEVLEKLYTDELEGVEVKDYYVELTYNEYDKVDEIKVPEEAKKSAIDGLDRDEDAEGEDEDKPKVKAAAQSKDLGDNWDSYTVQINDKVLTLPCSIADLESTGLTMDTEDIPADTTVEAEDYELAYFEDANGNELMVDLINMSAEPKSAKDCLVGGISVDDYGMEEGGLTVLFPGGITIGHSKEDVIAKYGETDDTYEGDSLHMFTWSDENSYYSQCEIDLDAETGKVCQMTMSCYE